MARKKKSIEVETLTHDESKRRNIPTAELQSVMRDEEKSPFRLAYERRNRDLDPQLVWRGKDEQDWSVLVDDGHDDPLHLIVEIKGYRREDAKEKKATMETYWVPGVNNLGQYGRWAFAEFTEVYQIEAEFNKLIDSVSAQPTL